MNNKIICPMCGEVVSYASYFQGYMCGCGWEKKDDKESKNIYKEVKNVIHNDLGITKQYIDDVIKETVQTEIDKLINDGCFIRGLIENEVMEALKRKDNNGWRTLHDATTFITNEINSTILETVRNKLEIKLKEDD